MKNDLPKPEDLGIKVCGDRVLVLVEEIKDEITTDGGLVIPQTGKEKEMNRAAQNIGHVVQIGSLAWDDMPEKWADVGDRVSYGKYAGTNIHDPKTDKTYRMLVDTDINAVYLD
jgi:co-chaperonin GroES (HSP10)